MTFGKDQDPVQQKPKFTPEELQRLIDEYFVDAEVYNRDESGKISIQKPLLITGLCDYIGIHKDTWYEYQKRPDYTEICRKAKQKIETFTVGMASINKTNPIITIFNLKNNFGYTDKIDVTTNQQPEQLTMEEIKKKLKGNKGD